MSPLFPLSLPSDASNLSDTAATTRAGRRPTASPGGPRRLRAALAALGLALVALGAPSSPALAAAARHAAHPPHAGRSVAVGHRQVGWASYYSHRLSGRRMANGAPLRTESDSAASKTLPLGTVARVTNLHNGRSAVVTIRDRGPHARGRILDVSPGVARELGMTQHGTAPVEVVVMRAPPGR